MPGHGLAAWTLLPDQFGMSLDGERVVGFIGPARDISMNNMKNSDGPPVDREDGRIPALSAEGDGC